MPSKVNRYRGTPEGYEWERLSKRMRSEPGACCALCGSTEHLSVDHLVPLARGGELLPGPDGLRLLCRSCNSRRGALQPKRKRRPAIGWARDGLRESGELRGQER